MFRQAGRCRVAVLVDQWPGERVPNAMTGTAARKPRPHRSYLAVIRTIDKFTEVTGYLFVIVIVPLILANVVEVFARYVLRSPTIWALDVTTMSYAALFMLGAALALLKSGPFMLPEADIVKR